MVSAYVDVFEELKCHDQVKFTFSGHNKTFLVYVFFKDYSKINPLDVLEELNTLVKKKGLCEKSVISENPEEVFSNSSNFKYVYCYRVVGLESQRTDCV